MPLMMGDGDGSLEGDEYDSEAVMVITTSALALYNALELLVLIFTTFKHRRGLYFWSILLSSFGVVPYAVGWLVDYFDLVINYVGMAIYSFGWILLITGQSVVLYSRLHLVVANVSIQRAVFWMIVVNGLTWHTTLTVLLFTTGSGPSKDGSHNMALFNTMEKVQMAFFCAQEFIISGLYLWRTGDIIKASFGSKRRFMWHLFMINVVIMAMDTALLIIIYKNEYLLEQGVKVVVYSIKLKLEFAVLGKLVELMQNRGGSNPSEGGRQPRNDTGAFVELEERGGTSKSGSTSCPGGEAVCLEDVGGSRREDDDDDDDDGRIMVTTRADVERGAEGDDESTSRLYEAAIKQISRDGRRE
ncbi:hypothetical protein ACJZ2D_007455 [Fusarium nematophilum]